jgi:hypothetical protein
MSIETTITSLKRAKAVCDEANRVPVAKRGMFAMVERRHSYSSLLHGAYAGYVGFTPCLVSSVDRAGIVKEVRLVGQTWPLKRRDWDQIMVDSASRITDPESVVRQLVDENGHAIEYRDRNEAIRAFKAAAGIP